DLLVGSPNAIDNPPDQTRRGLAKVFLGGPFQPFRAPPSMQVAQIDDCAGRPTEVPGCHPTGARDATGKPIPRPPIPAPACPLLAPQTRSVTIGRSVRVAIDICNAGDLPVSNLLTTMLFRSIVPGADGGAPTEVPITSTSIVDATVVGVQPTSLA